MKLEVGKTYLNEVSEIVMIVSEDIPSNGKRVFIDSVGRSYFEDGRYYYGHNEYSLCPL